MYAALPMHVERLFPCFEPMGMAPRLQLNSLNVASRLPLKTYNQDSPNLSEPVV